MQVIINQKQETCKQQIAKILTNKRQRKRQQNDMSKMCCTIFNQKGFLVNVNKKKKTLIKKNYIKYYNELFTSTKTLAFLLICCASLLLISSKLNILANAQTFEPTFSVGQSGTFNMPARQQQQLQDMLQNPELREERRNLMYPYNSMQLTDISSGKSVHDQPLKFRLPFFGFSYEYVWIQRDGYLTFNKGMQTYRFPLTLPIQPLDTFVQEDPAIIAPFFSMQDISIETPAAGVYFDVINLADPAQSTAFNYQLLRDRIFLDFKEGMIGASDFVPKWAMIVTWRNMTIANRRQERPLKTNSYQAVIATDEIRTYAMFNYEQIEWNTHLDNYDGLKGPAAFVGFNAGNTTRTFEFKPYSQHQRVTLLPSGGFGNNIRGRYFFQIDEEVWPGACIDKRLEPNLRDRLPLTFFPRYGHMLGGTLVDVTGPCLDSKSIIFCRFDNFKAEAVYRDTNHATCISPAFMYHGYVDLTISVDDKIEFVGRFYIQPPEIAAEDVIVLDNKDREEDPQEFRIKWHPQKLSWRNDTNVRASLWGYRESMTVYPSLTYISDLELNARLGQGMASLALANIRARDEPDFHDMLFGFISVELAQPSVLGTNMRQSPKIWSRPMPLAWYFRDQWLRASGNNYKDYICENWHERESFADRFAATVWRCPCLLEQVNIDRGRFLPDTQCNIIDRRCDTFHREALHCVNTGRPSIGGSGQTCCYDDHGELIQTADTIYGGRPSRAFVYGKHPFKIRMMIPSLSSWVHDVTPFFYCCLWQAKKDNALACQNYNYFRTSQDCSLYQPPAIGSIYGDPHIVTFNKHNYTFNGKGEYVLVHADDAKVKFDVQARFEQVPRRSRAVPTVPATQLTAIAAQDNFSSVVEFRVRPLAARWRYHIYVLVDNEYIFWWDKSMQVQNFRGVTLYQPAGIQNMSHIIAMFDSGAGVEVMSIDGFLTAHVFLPADLQNVTNGLLGSYALKSRSDLLLGPNNERYNARSRPDSLHRFGLSWRLTESERLNVGKTLFSHSSVRFAMFDEPNFQAEMQMPPQLPLELEHMRGEMDGICSDSASCIYDYIVSWANKELALATKRFETLAWDIANSASKQVVRCPALPKPANGMKSENRYWPGKVVRFSCDSGYRLVGYEARFCREDGLWSWGEDAECISVARYYFIMTGAVLTAVLPMLVCIAAGIVFMMYLMRRSRAHYTGEKGKLEMPFAAPLTAPPTMPQSQQQQQQQQQPKRRQVTNATSNNLAPAGSTQVKQPRAPTARNDDDDDEYDVDDGREFESNIDANDEDELINDVRREMIPNDEFDADDDIDDDALAADLGAYGEGREFRDVSNDLSNTNNNTIAANSRQRRRQQAPLTASSERNLFDRPTNSSILSRSSADNNQIGLPSMGGAASGGRRRRDNTGRLREARI